MDKSRHSVGATGESYDEMIGMPPKFKAGGYFGDKNFMPEEKKPPIEMPCETHPSQQFSRANLILVRDYLDKAMSEGLTSAAMSWVIKAIRELER